MALTSPVRCLLLTVLLILTFSGKSECLTSKVKNSEEIESYVGHYRNVNSIPQTIGDFKELPDKKYFSDGFKPKITQDFTLSRGEKKCRNKLCELYSGHRERRQLQSTYSLYDQLNLNKVKNNGYQPPTNNYGNYPNVNNIYPHYPNTSQYRPITNSTYGQSPNRNTFPNPNPGYSSSSRHTYPPSPRPLYNQYPTNNLSQTSNNLYPYNKNPTPIPPFHNSTQPHNPNYYPSYNGNSYPNINTNSSYPRFGQNNTRQTFNYPNNHNTMPNYYPSNVTPNPYNKQQNNSLPYNNFTQIAPLNPYQYQRNANSTYPYNLTGTSGMNSTGVNNYNPGPYYPTQNFTSNTPYSTNPNLAQNKFPSNSNPYYHSNYNGPPYDPLRRAVLPQRLSYK